MTFHLINSTVLDGLRELPDSSVHCCVTSPPYWALRDYGVAGQIGMERTPEEYVAKLVGVFREVRRVLRGDGTLWLNLGDCYNAYNGGSGPASTLDHPLNERNGQKPPLESGFGLRCKSLKPKDLVGIPWMLAFALRADGWYLRSDIIWSKPNPMPESVTDRPTKTHEYVFLLSKSERYYYDNDAIREPASVNSHARYAQGRGDGHKWRVGCEGANSIFHQDRDLSHLIERKIRAPGVHPKSAEPGSGIKANASFSAAVKDLVAHRTKRTVWTIATEPYPDAHFATFPTKLVEPCVLAGCPEGGTVLDPFMGSGTTGVVALKTGLNFVGIELNPAYVALAEKRIADVCPLFASTHKALALS
jgi:DNA modification methylase